MELPLVTPNCACCRRGWQFEFGDNACLQNWLHYASQADQASASTAGKGLGQAKQICVLKVGLNHFNLPVQRLTFRISKGVAFWNILSQ